MRGGAKPKSAQAFRNQVVAGFGNLTPGATKLRHHREAVHHGQFDEHCPACIELAQQANEERQTA